MDSCRHYGHTVVVLLLFSSPVLMCSVACCSGFLDLHPNTQSFVPSLLDLSPAQIKSALQQMDSNILMYTYPDLL